MDPFRTERLKLRLPTLADQDNLFLLDNNPNVMRYIGDGQVKSRQVSEAYLAQAIGISDGKRGYWVAELAETGAFVGWFVLKKLDRTDDTEIGYRLAEQMWGKGYATEGAACILRHAFEYLKLDQLVAVTIPENKESQNVLQKIGLKYEKEDHYYNSKVAYFSLQKQEYLNLVVE